MIWTVLAETVVALHLAFVVFAVAGGFLAWRRPSIVWLHLPALVWAAWIEVSGAICPLTPLEGGLRERAGGAGYSDGFIEHYALPLLYPLGLTRHIQWSLAGVLLAVNALAYGMLFLRSRARTRVGPHPELHG